MRVGSLTSAMASPGTWARYIVTKFKASLAHSLKVGCLADALLLSDVMVSPLQTICLHTNFWE